MTSQQDNDISRLWRFPWSSEELDEFSSLQHQGASEAEFRRHFPTRTWEDIVEQCDAVAGSEHSSTVSSVDDNDEALTRNAREAAAAFQQSPKMTQSNTRGWTWSKSAVDQLMSLKEAGLQWRKIVERFPGRTMGAVQQKYHREVTNRRAVERRKANKLVLQSLRSRAQAQQLATPHVASGGFREVQTQDTGSRYSKTKPAQASSLGDIQDTMDIVQPGLREPAVTYENSRSISPHFEGGEDPSFQSMAGQSATVSRASRSQSPYQHEPITTAFFDDMDEIVTAGPQPDWSALLSTKDIWLTPSPTASTTSSSFSLRHESVATSPPSYTCSSESQLLAPPPSSLHPSNTAVDSANDKYADLFPSTEDADADEDLDIQLLKESAFLAYFKRKLRNRTMNRYEKLDRLDALRIEVAAVQQQLCHATKPTLR